MPKRQFVFVQKRLNLISLTSIYVFSGFYARKTINGPPKTASSNIHVKLKKIPYFAVRVCSKTLNERFPDLPSQDLFSFFDPGDHYPEVFYMYPETPCICSKFKIMLDLMFNIYVKLLNTKLHALNRSECSTTLQFSVLYPFCGILFKWIIIQT